eukprot:g1507.t1
MSFVGVMEEDKDRRMDSGGAFKRMNSMDKAYNCDTLFNLNNKTREDDRDLLCMAFAKEEEEGSSSHKQLCTPVKMMVVAKKLVENHEGELQLIATVMQTPVGLSPATINDSFNEDREKREYFFRMRVNDGAHEHDTCFTTRKVKKANTETNLYTEVSTTFLAKLPLIKRQVFSLHPFHIMALETTIELTSCVGTLGGHREDTIDSDDEAGGHSGRTKKHGAKKHDAKKKIELRPNLLCNTKDKRSILHVKGGESGADAMRSYDFVELSPTVEIKFDGGKGKSYYAPAIKITWFVYRGWVQGFLETIMPIIFAVFCNALNTKFFYDDNENQIDYLANTLAIGLTVVFIIPQLSSNDESFEQKANVNHAYVTLLFLGLISSLAGGEWYLDSSTETEKEVWQFFALYVSNVLTMGSLLIPLSSCIRFVKVQRLISATSRARQGPDDCHSEEMAGKCSFLDQPEKKIGDEIGNWAPFFVQDWERSKAEKKNGGPRKDLGVNPDINYPAGSDERAGWKAVYAKKAALSAAQLKKVVPQAGGKGKQALLELRESALQAATPAQLRELYALERLGGTPPDNRQQLEDELRAHWACGSVRLSARVSRWTTAYWNWLMGVYTRTSEDLGPGRPSASGRQHEGRAVTDSAAPLDGVVSGITIAELGAWQVMPTGFVDRATGKAEAPVRKRSSSRAIRAAGGREARRIRPTAAAAAGVGGGGGGGGGAAAGGRRVHLPPLGGPAAGRAGGAGRKGSVRVHGWAKGDSLDVKDVTGTWARAEVVQVRPDPAELKVHYVAWGSQWDEWLSPGRPDHAARMAKLGTHVFTGHAPPRAEQRLECCREGGAQQRGEWLVARVEEVDQAKGYRVRYHGLGEVEDEWVARADSSRRLVPFGTHHQMA